MQNGISSPHHARGNRWNDTLQSQPPSLLPSLTSVSRRWSFHLQSSTIKFSQIKFYLFIHPSTFLYIFHSSFTLMLFSIVSFSLSFINVLPFVFLFLLHFYHLLNLMLTNSLDFYSSDLLTSFLLFWWVFFPHLLYSEYSLDRGHVFTKNYKYCSYAKI